MYKTINIYLPIVISDLVFEYAREYSFLNEWSEFCKKRCNWIELHSVEIYADAYWRLLEDDKDGETRMDSSDDYYWFVYHTVPFASINFQKEKELVSSFIYDDDHTIYDPEHRIREGLIRQP